MKTTILKCRTDDGALGFSVQHCKNTNGIIFLHYLKFISYILINYIRNNLVYRTHGLVDIMYERIESRKWMYKQYVKGRSYNNEAFMIDVGYFIITSNNSSCLYDDNVMRCLCSKCKNKKFIYFVSVEEHVCRNDSTWFDELVWLSRNVFAT